jgi:hypothetical protein
VADADLPGPGLAHRKLDESHHLGSAELGDLDGAWHGPFSFAVREGRG